ncbi:DUF502 domain-containing protein [Bacteroidia bacterium]|jgi:uncharacterized membrane protein|nr:DUF502 domain-containing protein [Bacteroidia bacterium]
MTKLRIILFLRRISRKFIENFLKGIVIVLPLAIIGYLIYTLVSGLDDLFTKFFPYLKNTVGLGLLFTILIILGAGILSGSIIGLPFNRYFKLLVEKTPGIKVLYKPLKDFFEGLVGEKKKFSVPILVKLNSDPEIYQFGFITQDDLEFIGMAGYISVYCPKSYGIMGDLFVVKAANVQQIHSRMNASEVMKFVVSGGVASDVDDELEKE